MKRARSRLFVLVAALLLCYAFTACKKADKTPPKGSAAYAVSDDGEFAAVLYPDRLVLLHDGKEEFNGQIANLRGMNHMPGGVMLLFTGGKQRIFTYQTYGGEPARELIEKLASGDLDPAEEPEEDAEEGGDEQEVEEPAD